MTMNKLTIIVGPEKSGKSNKAREIAGAIGSYKEVTVSHLCGAFGVGEVLDSEPMTVIIDDCYIAGRSSDMVGEIRRMVSFSEINCNIKMRKPFIRRTPNVIICIPDLNHGIALANYVAGDKPYTVINLG